MLITIFISKLKVTLFWFVHLLFWFALTGAVIMALIISILLEITAFEQILPNFISLAIYIVLVFELTKFYSLILPSFISNIPKQLDKARYLIVYIAFFISFIANLLVVAGELKNASFETIKEDEIKQKNAYYTAMLIADRDKLEDIENEYKLELLKLNRYEEKARVKIEFEGNNGKNPMQGKYKEALSRIKQINSDKKLIKNDFIEQANTINSSIAKLEADKIKGISDIKNKVRSNDDDKKYQNPNVRALLEVIENAFFKIKYSSFVVMISIIIAVLLELSIFVTVQILGLKIKEERMKND